jgi:AAHS family 3-hydroxyphenylpropionic acid transporter
MLRELFGQRRAFKTLLLWASFFLIVLTLHLMLNWLPSLLSARGLAKNSTAIAQAAFNAGGAAVALWLGALLDSPRQRTSIAVSIVLLPVILLLIAFSPPRAVVLAVLACLLGGAILAQQVILYGVASAYYPAAARGAGIGAAVAVGRFGSLIGPLFAASLLAAGRTPSQVLIGVLPIVLACGVCVGLLGWQELAAPAGRRVHRRNDV